MRLGTDLTQLIERRGQIVAKVGSNGSLSHMSCLGHTRELCAAAEESDEPAHLSESPNGVHRVSIQGHDLGLGAMSRDCYEERWNGRRRIERRGAPGGSGDEILANSCATEFADRSRLKSSAMSRIAC